MAKIENPQNIIIARTDKIGDLVLSIPSFVAIRKMYKDAKIYALVRKYNAPILDHLNCIDEIISIDNYDDNELLNKVKSINADVFIALYSDKKILKLASLSNIDVRVGPLSKFKSFFVYNQGVFQKRSRSIKNEAEYNLDLVKKLNEELFSTLDLETEKIKYTKEDDNFAKKFLEENELEENKFILIHPFTGGSAKNISPDHYISVIKKLRDKDKKLKIALSCADSDLENAVYISDKTDKTPIFTNQGRTILALAALIDKAHLFVGGSTGPSHIAGNLNKKCVCLYPVKPTMSPTRWGLFLNNKVTYLSPDEGNKSENYKTDIFDKIDDAFLDKFAKCIIEAFYKDE